MNKQNVNKTDTINLGGVHDMLTPEQRDNFNKAKIIFNNFNRMKTEIELLKQSIDFYSKNVDKAVNEDIESASVSHPAENSGGYNPNVSVDKVANIACNLGDMQNQYYNEISKLKYKRNVFIHAVTSIETFVNRLSEDKAEVIKQHFYSEKRKSLSVIAIQMERSERGLRNMLNETVYKYSVSANYDLNMVVELLT